MEAVTKYKMKIVEYLCKNLGKNPSIIFIYRMGKVLNTDEIFNHLIKNTTFFQDIMNRSSDFDIEHSIDGFEAFITLCKNL